MAGLKTTAMAALAGLLALTAALSGKAAPRDPVFGDWFTKDHDAKIRIGPCVQAQDLACGVVVWLKDPNEPNGQPSRDTANPRPALRTRTLLGLPLLEDFHREADGRWADGKIYDPQNGMTFRSKMSAQPNGTLKVSGCVLMICAGQSWTRTD